MRHALRTRRVGQAVEGVLTGSGPVGSRIQR
jgi:hypothetical protein